MNRNARGEEDQHPDPGHDSLNMRTPWLAHMPLKISETSFEDVSVVRRIRKPAKSMATILATAKATTMSRSCSVLRCANTICTSTYTAASGFQHDAHKTLRLVDGVKYLDARYRASAGGGSGGEPGQPFPQASCPCRSPCHTCLQGFVVCRLSVPICSWHRTPSQHYYFRRSAR